MVTLIPFIRSFMVSFDPCKDLDEAGYLIHAMPGGADFTPSESNKINDGPETSFTYKIPDGQPAGLWGVKIAAYDTFGEEVLNYSSLYTVTVATLDPLDVVPPDVPTWGINTSSIDSSGPVDVVSISLNWTLDVIPGDFSNYVLAYKLSTDTNWTNITTTANTYKLSNLICGASYDFRVLAVDQWNNQSNWSDTATVVAAVDTAAPAVPTGLAATTAFSSVFITWDANTEADFLNYMLQVSTDDVFTSPSVYTCQSTSFTYTGVAGSTYYVRIAAVDYSKNTSDFSASVSATTALVKAADIDNFAIDASKTYSMVPVIKEDSSSVWTANFPIGGISWTNHTIIYKSNIFNVTAGNTTNSYVNADLSGPGGALSYTTSNTQASDTDQFTLAKNTSGKLEVVWQSQANVVIGSAYIMDGAITNEKVGNLVADKITSGTLDCSLVTLKNLVVDSSGSITWGTLSGRPNTVADLNATDGTTLATAAVNASTAVGVLNTLQGAGGKLTYIGATGLYSGTINVANLTAGTFTGGGIGFSTGATVNLDGTNARITINDGTRDRFYAGKLGTGDYGVNIMDASGNSVVKVSNSSGAVLQNATVGNLIVSGAGILCGTGGSAFKVWDAGSGSVNMYVGDYNTAKQNYLWWDGSKLKIAADVIMSSTSTISWSNINTSSIPSNVVNATSDVVLIGRANCVVVGNTVTKTGGVLGWDSDCYSKDAFTSGAYCSFVPSQNNLHVMVGLGATPTLNASYETINYAMYANNDGTLFAYESGTGHALGCSYSIGDVLSVVYDGSFVRYMQNGNILRSIVAPANLTLSLDSSFYDPGVSVSNLKFGPMSANNWSNIGGVPSDLMHSSTYIDSNNVFTGNIYAENIHGTTITGKTLQTAASGQRVVIDGSLNELFFVDSSGSIKAWIGTKNVGLGSCYGTFGSYAAGESNVGLIGQSYSNFGLYGFSVTTCGVIGSTTASNWGGVYGMNPNYLGVRGDGVIGVMGSGTNMGVYAYGTNLDLGAYGSGVIHLAPRVSLPSNASSSIGDICMVWVSGQGYRLANFLDIGGVGHWYELSYGQALS